MESFGKHLWISPGPPITAALGFAYPTRMAVAKLADDGLWLWSPVAPSKTLFAEVEALGTPAWIIAPNTLHHVHVAAWKARFPDARIAAAPGFTRPGQSGKPVDFDIDLGLDSLPADWRDSFEAVVLHNRLMTEMVFFHRPSGTAIFTDLLQNMPPDWYRGWRRVVARLDRMTEAEPTVPRKFRINFPDRPATKAAVETILGWPIERVLMAHGTPVRSEGRTLIHRAFDWL